MGPANSLHASAKTRLQYNVRFGLEISQFIVPLKCGSGVVLSDPFLGMEAWRNFTETQQSDHAPRSGPEVKNGSSAKDGAWRLRCGKIQEVSLIRRNVGYAIGKHLYRFHTVISIALSVINNALKISDLYGAL